MRMVVIGTFFAVVLAPPALVAQPAPPVTPATPVQAPNVPPGLADWTPRPATGKAEAWEKATDKDWVDPRFRLMDTGPFLDCTFRYPASVDKAVGPYLITKATTVKLPGGGAVFDRNTMSFPHAWTGNYLVHSDRRFGLLNTPTPAGPADFTASPAPTWGAPPDLAVRKSTATQPIDPRWARYRGLYRHGDKVVFAYTVQGRSVLHLAELASDGAAPRFRQTITVDAGAPALSYESPQGPIRFEPSKEPLTSVGGAKPIHDVSRDLTQFTKGGPKRWGEPLVTRLVRGPEAGPFAIDTLTIPYDNPWKALFFCTGLDFLPDGRIAICTCHGDVWLVAVNEQTGNCSWQRYATGLYHPLGLKVVAGKVVVLERGQLTRLHDLNSDNEADFYECISNDWDTGSGEHAYDTCLETDASGNFYFFKTGDTNLPTGGCLIRVSADGSKTEVYATGFRHPIGMGMSPDGKILTGADQEGNWMPATRIDEYKQGGFYGDMRGHHRAEPPKIYDGPLLWLPREVDNSAGGQVWVPADAKGGWAPLAGLPLHLSYGRCKAFILLRQAFVDGSQGGVWDLGWRFLSGVCRGRFGPDGNLYVCGLNGWQTAAQADGCLQRVRPTGKPLQVPVQMEVVADGVKLRFSTPLDRKQAEDPSHYRAAAWNYKWSGEYGSKRYRPSAPTTEGQDDLPIKAVRLSPDGRTVHVVLGKVNPVMQMQVGLNVKAADQSPVVGSVFLTVHKTSP